MAVALGLGLALVVACFPSLDGLSGGDAARPEGGGSADVAPDTLSTSGDAAPDVGGDADASAPCVPRAPLRAFDPRFSSCEGGVPWDGSGPSFVCDPDNVLAKDGLFAGLDRDTSNETACIEGLRVVSCVGVEFDAAVRSVRVSARSVDDTPCNGRKNGCDGAVDCASRTVTLRVFRKKPQSVDYAYVDYLDAGVPVTFQTLTETEVPLGAPSDTVLLCTGANILERDPDPEIDSITGCP